MSESEWKEKYVTRFLRGPWVEGDMTADTDMRKTARSLADEAWNDDPEADPEDCASDELSEWRC